jgi:hypothetical protein
MVISCWSHKKQEKKIIAKLENLLNIGYNSSLMLCLEDIRALNPELATERQAYAYLKAVSDVKQAIEVNGLQSTLTKFRKDVESNSKYAVCVRCTNYDHCYGYWLGLSDTFLLIESHPLVELYSQYSA